MKEKIYNLIGMSIVGLGKIALITLLATIISTAIFESERDDMFFQVIRVFDGMYQAREEMILEQNGIISEDDVDQDDWSYTITSVADKKERPKILEDIGTLCVNKFFPENPNEVTQTHMSDARQCIKQQVKDAIVISKVYMDHADELEDGPTKRILNTVILGCHKNNTNDEVIDFTDTLECIREQLNLVNEHLDTELTRLERKKGI